MPSAPDWRSASAYAHVHEFHLRELAWEYLRPSRRGCCHPRPSQTRTCRFPASGSSRGSFVSGGIAVDDPGPWQRVAGEERTEASPCEPLPARSPFQPLAPRLRDLLAILLQPPEVPRDAVIGIVTDECHRQPGVLIEHGPVSVLPAPVLDRGQRAGKTGLRRYLPHHV